MIERLGGSFSVYKEYEKLLSSFFGILILRRIYSSLQESFRGTVVRAGRKAR